MKSEDFSQQTVRNYLIGNLDETTVDALDELSIADQEFADRVALEQYDLVDDWVSGRLDPTERTAFGLVLARSPALVEKAKIAQLLTAAPRVAVTERNDKSGFFAALIAGFRKPAYVLSGLALLIGVSVIALLFLRQDKVTQLAEISPTASASPAPTVSVDLEQISEPTPASASNASPSQNTATANWPKPSSRPTRRSTPIFATLFLAPPTRGGSGIRSVALQPGAEFLQLAMQTEAESSGRFIVEIGDPSGSTDWRSQVIRGRSDNGRTTISVRVPAASLKKGMRGVRLLDAGAGSEILDEHVVRIER